MSALAPGPEDLREALERAAEWERDALSGDRTRPRVEPLGPRLAACGCTSEDARACRCWPVTTDAGTICLCLFHDGAADDPNAW